MESAFVIIGAGAIGGFVGTLLHDAGVAVKFLVRDSERSRRQREVLAKVGLTVTCSLDPSFRKQVAAADIPRVFTTDAAGCLASASCVFVATKRMENAAVHKQLVENNVTCPVVFLQNGLRISSDLPPKVYEAIESVVYFNTVFDAEAGVITLPQAMDDASLALDGKQPSAARIAAAFAATPLKTVAVQPFFDYQCGKLLLNLNNAVNALSGLHIAPMLMQRPYRLVLAASIGEAKEVFTAARVVLRAVKPQDERFLRWSTLILRSPQVVFEAAVGRKLRGRGAGHTSMAQDLLARRVPTEIDFLNGAIVGLGQQLGVATPVNERLVALVKQAELANAGCPGLSGAALAEATGVPLDAGWPVAAGAAVCASAGLGVVLAALAVRTLPARL